MENLFIFVSVMIISLMLLLALTSLLIKNKQQQDLLAFKRENEGFISVLNTLGSEKIKVNYYIFEFSQARNVKIENGTIKIWKDDKESLYFISQNVSNTELFNVKKLCIQKIGNEISISEECKSFCDFNGECNYLECKLDCPDCYGPNPICVGDNYCNKNIGESVCNSIDCSTEGKTKSEGEKCSCDEECKNDLICTKIQENRCCPKDKSYWCDKPKTGEPRCMNKEEFEKECSLEINVLIVSFKSTMEKVYSQDDINKLINKINEFIDVLRDYDNLNGVFLFLDQDEVLKYASKKVTDVKDWGQTKQILYEIIKKFNVKYVIIVGGFDRFPQPGVSCCPSVDKSEASGLMFSDSKYVDFNDDNFPDIIIARVPDPNKGDIEVLLNAFSSFIAAHKNGEVELNSFISPIMGCGGYDNKDYCSGKCFCYSVFPQYAHPCGNYCGCIYWQDLNNKNFVMILTHGPGAMPYDFLHGGCINSRPTDLLGINVKNSVWFSMACGGGHLRLKDTTENSFVMTFLKQGGLIYIASTDLNYGRLGPYPDVCAIPGCDYRIGTLYTLIMRDINKKVSKTLGEIYYEGKKEYFMIDPTNEFIIYHVLNNHFYGDPTIKLKKAW